MARNQNTFRSVNVKLKIKHSFEKCIFYCIGIIWVPFNIEKQNKTLERLYLNLFFELAPES